MNWQPITTAPKTFELLLFQNGRVTWGQWDENLNDWIWWDYDKNYDPPTHWMLPPEGP